MIDIQHVNHVVTSILRQAGQRGRTIGIIVLAGLLVGCADDTATTDDRRFANQQSSETATTATPPPPPPVASPSTPVPQASPESLLSVEGSPGVIYALLNGSIRVVDAGGADPGGRIVAPESWRFVAIASSPVESHVAALMAPADDEAPGGLEVAIYDRQGQILERWSDLPFARSQSATPAADGDADETATASISWAPAGDRLLVATGGSELVRIDVGGDAQLISVPPPVERVTSAKWSFQGDQIALLARNAEGSGAIWVFSPYVDGESMRQVAPPNADASDLGSVTEFAWLPDGSTLAYILSTETGPEAQGGQLYTINLKLGIKLLVATPGRGGPAAEIVDFALSPDGRAVAYTIAMPVDEGWRFHSLWVRSFQAPGVYNVPVGNVERVDQLWWAGSGIAWLQRSGDLVEVVAKAAGLSPATVLTLEPGAEGTPGATPVVATPVAATPVAATPDQGTPALATPTG